MEYILDTKGSKSALSYDEPSEKTLKLEYKEVKDPIRGVDLQSYEQAKAKPTPTSNSKPARPKVNIPHFQEPLGGLMRTLTKEGPNGLTDSLKEDLSTERYKNENSLRKNESQNEAQNPNIFNCSDIFDSQQEAQNFNDSANTKPYQNLKIKKNSTGSNYPHSTLSDPKTLSLKRRYQNFLKRSQIGPQKPRPQISDPRTTQGAYDGKIFLWGILGWNLPSYG
jgi:hypothetical protein